MKEKLNSPLIKFGAPALLVVGLLLYIIFAPDTMWKPIQIRFESAPAAAAGNEAEMGTSNGASLEESHATSGEPIAINDSLLWQPGRGVVYPLDAKVVNLADPGGLRYLQATVVLEFRPLNTEWYELEGEARLEAQAAFEEKLATRRPLIDDAITMILSSKSYSQIATIEGKLALKQEILSGVNNALGYQGVVNVYFTEFVIQ